MKWNLRCQRVWYYQKNSDNSLEGMKGSIPSPNRSTNDANNDPTSPSSFHASANDIDFPSLDLPALFPYFLALSSIELCSPTRDLHPSPASPWLLPSAPSRLRPSLADPNVSLSKWAFFWGGWSKSAAAGLFPDGDICICDSRFFVAVPTHAEVLDTVMDMLSMIWWTDMSINHKVKLASVPQGTTLIINRNDNCISKLLPQAEVMTAISLCGKAKRSLGKDMWTGAQLTIIYCNFGSLL